VPDGDGPDPARPGDQEDLERLVPQVYDQLRRIAHAQLSRRSPGQTLNTTAVVHEAYLKLARAADASWGSRAHFMALAARVMRQVIVDYARERQARKRGGGQPPLALDETLIAAEAQAERLVALDQALERLGGRLVRVVECRFFAGLSEAETAAALDVSLRTVQRDWEQAKAWLRQEMGDE
jgi:RNA polymerase sigma factor (TIGR02999 family)